MTVAEIVHARGHRNVRSTHTTTLEVTRETDLTERGSCIIAVAADKGAADLSAELKEALRREEARVTVTVECGGLQDSVRARGSPRLSFTHPTDLVVRRSGYVCGRTVAILADRAASDLSRRLVDKLRDPSQRVKVIFAVETH